MSTLQAGPEDAGQILMFLLSYVWGLEQTLNFVPNPCAPGRLPGFK